MANHITVCVSRSTILPHSGHYTESVQSSAVSKALILPETQMIAGLIIYRLQNDPHLAVENTSGDQATANSDYASVARIPSVTSAV